MAEKTVELFQEILPSDRLNAYQYFSANIMAVIDTSDPGTIWEHLRFNPWVAMAIYDDMEEKDAAVYSALDSRKTNVLSKPRIIIPASNKRQDRRIADFVEECLSTNYFIDFEAFLSEALEALPKGVSIGEIIWANASDRAYIEKVNFKPQQLFAFGATGYAGYSTATLQYPQTGNLRLRDGVLTDTMAMGAELPEDQYKFFVFSYATRYGNRWGNPLMRKVFWQSWIKRNGIKAWLKYLEKGSGAVQAKYRGGSGKEEQQKALDLAIALSEESAVASSDSVEVVIHEMIRNVGSSHKEMVDDFCNPEISRAILGGTLTARGSDGGGSRALGEVHERTADRIGEVDSKALMPVVNRYIIKPLVKLKFGPNALCPAWALQYDPPEDQDNKAKRYGVLRKEVGLPLSKKQMYDEFQAEPPIDEADTLSGEPVQTQKVPSEDPLDAETLTEFAEKKTLKSARPSSSKTERFQRLRPSMIRFSPE